MGEHRLCKPGVVGSNPIRSMQAGRTVGHVNTMVGATVA